jgi:hypothetical protein
MKNTSLSQNGLLLVIYVSVLIIEARYEDALRAIRIIRLSKFPDKLC